MLKTKTGFGCTWEISRTIPFPHGFFSHKGGVSEGIYQGLNCGPGSRDLPENVQRNREIVAQILSKHDNTPLVSAYQIHSNKAIYIDTKTQDPRPKADAMVTDQPGIILGILTADCTPILFADTKRQIIGAAHAGWKGAFTDIIEATVQAMEAIGAKREDIIAASGPTIQQNSYEVDENFRQTFISENSTFEQFFTNGTNQAHFQFDLPAFVKSKIDAAGISSFEQSTIDTYSSDHHFSYRRTTHKNESDYGRQVSTIMLPRISG